MKHDQKSRHHRLEPFHGVLAFVFLALLSLFVIALSVSSSAAGCHAVTAGHTAAHVKKGGLQ